MTKTYAFIEIAKRKNNITSDYAIARLLNVTPQKLSNWKKGESEANAMHTLKILQLAGISIEEAIQKFDEEKEFELPMKQAGFANVSSMVALSAVSLLGASYLSNSPILAGVTATVFAGYTLCEVIK